jgi:hypothetical protein
MESFGEDIAADNYEKDPISECLDWVQTIEIADNVTNTNSGLLPSEIHYARSIVRKMHPLQDLELALVYPIIATYSTLCFNYCARFCSK